MRAIQHLIKWKQSDKAATAIPEVLKKGVLYQGIKVFLGEGKHKSKEVNAFMQSVKSDKISQERQQDISKIIGRLVFDLFDLNYHEYKASLVLQGTTNKTTRSRLEQLLSTRSEAEAIQDFLKEKQTNSVPELDFEDIERKIIRNSMAIVLQHFDIVMGHAFSSLNTLPIELRRTICTEFLNHMQYQMHWPKTTIQSMVSDVIEEWLDTREDEADVRVLEL